MSALPEFTKRAEREAARLTRQQLDAVMRGSIGDHPIQTVRALVRKGIMYHHIDSPNGQCGPMRLTPYGIAVQAAVHRARTAQEGGK